jgi:hypothetical protein
MLYHLHLFFSAALHRRSGMEITGRTQSTGRDHGSPRIPHRLRIGSSTKCARRQCAPVDCRPNSAARGRSAAWRRLNGPRSGQQGDCDCSDQLLSSHSEQAFAGCVKHCASHDGVLGWCVAPFEARWLQHRVDIHPAFILCDGVVTN